MSPCLRVSVSPSLPLSPYPLDRCQPVFVIEEKGYVLEQLHRQDPDRHFLAMEKVIAGKLPMPNKRENYLLIPILVILMLLVIWLHDGVAIASWRKHYLLGKL